MTTEGKAGAGRGGGVWGKEERQTSFHMMHCSLPNSSKQKWHGWPHQWQGVVRCQDSLRGGKSTKSNTSAPVSAILYPSSPLSNTEMNSKTCDSESVLSILIPSSLRETLCKYHMGNSNRADPSEQHNRLKCTWTRNGRLCGSEHIIYLWLFCSRHLVINIRETTADWKAKQNMLEEKVPLETRDPTSGLEVIHLEKVLELSELSWQGQCHRWHQGTLVLITEPCWCPPIIASLFGIWWSRCSPVHVSWVDLCGPWCCASLTCFSICVYFSYLTSYIQHQAGRIM